jgi:hypothetical protein
VFVALAWGAVPGWLNEYERYAQDIRARAERLASAPAPAAARPQPRAQFALPPRKLFGLAFESRPPPLSAA